MGIKEGCIIETLEMTKLTVINMGKLKGVNSQVMGYLRMGR